MPEQLTNKENRKLQLLEIATGIGQREPLAKLFKIFPESRANHWAVVDFNKPSSENRLFVFDVKNGNIKSYLVAHGKNSGERYATDFSNTEDSNCSSLGIYKTGEEYSGKHGRSVYLNGLEATNDNALSRHIVLHSADYVVPDYEGTGRAGRSEGCFVVNTAYKDEVVDCLKEGSYLIAWHSHPHFV